MSYARFSHADVYVFMNSAGYLDCCGCILQEVAQFHTTQGMIDHLAKHRAAGHAMPDDIEQALWEDDDSNFVNYRRCDLDGCDKRVTCGSPTSGGGYVSACSVEHGRRLGGFRGWDS